jgi:hypothetical protein
MFLALWIPVWLVIGFVSFTVTFAVTMRRYRRHEREALPAKIDRLERELGIGQPELVLPQPIPPAPPARHEPARVESITEWRARQLPEWWLDMIRNAPPNTSIGCGVPLEVLNRKKRDSAKTAQKWAENMSCFRAG